MKHLFLILALVFSSCELVVDVDVPYDHDLLVLNSLVATDSTWKVELSRSKFILDDPNTYYPVPVGLVSIQDSDGSKIVLTHDQFGTFRGPGSPQPGHHYEITAQSQGFETVTAEMTVPAIVPIKQIDWDPINVTSTGLYSQAINVPVGITFDDPADVVNFYDASYQVFYKGKAEDPQTGEIVEYHQSTFSNFRIEDAALGPKDELIHGFNDITFNGHTITVHLIAQYQIPYQAEVYKGIFRFRSLSEGAFKYTDTMNRQLNSGYDPFAQPVQVFNNITNGLGVFGGISYDEIEWEK